MTGIGKVCQVMERCDGHGRGICKGTWGVVTVVRKCDSHQGSVKGIIKMCQCMERCDGHWEDVRRCRKV